MPTVRDLCLERVKILWPGSKNSKNSETSVRLMNRLKIEDARLHDLRHSTASYLIMAGVDIRTIQNILGHTDIATTRTYTHLAPGHMKKAFAKLKNLEKISNGQYPKLEIDNK